MHIKLSIRERTWYTLTQKRVKVQNESNNTAMPLLKITAGCTAAKFPVLFSAAVKQWKNLNVHLAKRKS